MNRVFSWSALAATLWLTIGLGFVLVWPLTASVLRVSYPPDRSVEMGVTPTPIGMGGELWTRPAGLAWTTLKVVLLTEAIALPIGLPLAFFLFRTDAWARKVALGLLLVAAFVPLPLYATEWLGAFGNVGRAQILGVTRFLFGWRGASFVHAMAAIPWIVVLAGLGFRTVEPALEELALLDFPGWLVVFRVTLRRSLGGIAASALAVAVLTAGEMTVTDLLQVRTYAEESYIQYQLGNERAATAVALPPLVLIGCGLLLGGGWLLALEPERLPSPGGRARTWRLGGFRVPLGVLVLVATLLLNGFPIASLVWRAGRLGGNAELGLSPRWSAWGLLGTLRSAAGELGEPLGTTLILGSLAALGSVALAWPLAWASRRSIGWRLIAVFAVAVTLAAPGPVVGSALVLAYKQMPIIYDTPVIMILAYITRSFPYAFLVLWPGVRGLPERYFEAAAVEGVGPFSRVWSIALPLSLGPIVAAWAVALVLSIGELPASFLVEVPGYTTIAKRIWELLHTGVESHLAGVALVVLAVIAGFGGLAGLAVARLGPKAIEE